MIVIHYPTAFKALDQFIEAYNINAPDLKSRIKSGTVLAAKELVRIYGVSLLKANLEDIDPERLPSLKTNNRQLASLVKCSTRTVQRHIFKLRQAGLITAKIFHGSNSGYELFITREVLLAKLRIPVHKAEQALKDVLKKTRTAEALPVFSEPTTTKCPHTYSGYKSYTNNILIGCEQVENPDATSYGTGDITGNTREIDLDNHRDNAGKKQVTEYSGDQRNNAGWEDAREIDSRVEPPGILHPPDPAREQFLDLYTGLLWLMARNLLYRRADLTQRQVLIAKKLIRQLYEHHPTQNLTQLHQQYVERIVLVDKYIKKDPSKRFVTLPYKYFDPTNAFGFAATRTWYESYLKHKKETEQELILSRAIRRYQRNQSAEASKKKSSLQLFRECETSLGKLKNPVLLDRFYAAVLNHSTYQLLNSSLSC